MDAEIVVYERNNELAAETTAKSGAFIGHWGHESSSRFTMMRYVMVLYNDWLRNPETDLSYRHVQRLRITTTEEGAHELASELSRWREASRETTVTTGRELAYYVDGDNLKR